MTPKTKLRKDYVEAAAERAYLERLGGSPGFTAKHGTVVGDAADTWLKSHDPKHTGEPRRYAAEDLRDVDPKGTREDAELVYFVQHPAGAVKIGYSTTRSWRARIERMQCDNAEALTVLRIVAGTRPLEARLHKQFRPVRIRGEWFEPDAELIALATRP